MKQNHTFTTQNTASVRRFEKRLIGMRKIVLLRPQAMTLQTLAGDFKQHLQILGHSTNGCQAKYRYLLEFLAKMEQQGISEMNQVQPTHLFDHYQYLITRPNQNQAGTLSVKSAISHLQAIQLFFNWLLDCNLVTTHPASALNLPYPSPASQRNALTQQQVKKLYSVAQTHQETALLSLAYGCGLRATELQMLNLEEVRLHERIIIVRAGKGNKSRTIPINHKVATGLQNYLDHERGHTTVSKAYMLNVKGKRMKTYTCNKYLKRVAQRAGIEGVTTHLLRHSIATHLIEQGVAVQQVRRFLGHSQLETTQVYTHVSNEALRSMKLSESDVAKLGVNRQQINQLRQ